VTTEAPREFVLRLVATARRLLPSQQDEAIAFSRLLLAAVALLAIYIDPTQPTRFSQATYIILAVYVTWSSILAVRAWTSPDAPGHYLATHILDVCVFIALMYLTEGPGSPFFVFFTFSIISAGLKWGARGAVLTATVVLVAFLTTTFLSSSPEAGEVNRVIVRVAYLVVVAVLIGFFGWHRQSTNQQLQRLSEWPEPAPTLSDDPPIAESLEHAALVLGVSRLAVLWSEDRRGWNLASWSGTECLFSTWPNSEPPLVVSRSGSLSDMCLSPDLPTALHYTSVIAAQFVGPHHHGAVLILDPPRKSLELQRLADIVSRRVTLELEQFRLRRDLAEAAISRERERLARDMHDGILQDLTAVGLHLETIARKTPEPHLSTIRSLSALVMEQQARIRSFVNLMNPRMRRSRSVSLSAALERSVDTLERQWQVQLTSSVEPADAEVTESQEVHLRSLLGEATANAVRHGGATVVKIRASVGDAIEVVVADNGRQKPPHPPGISAGPAPASLQQRIADLGGKYDFTVGDDGGRLVLVLPRGF
jgi:signal transduction histidine kinase